MSWTMSTETDSRSQMLNHFTWIKIAQKSPASRDELSPWLFKVCLEPYFIYSWPFIQAMIHSLLWASALTQLTLVTFLLIRRASQGAFLNSRNPWLTFFFRHLESFFSDISMQSTSLRNEQCTCAVIKPSFLHRSGEIINAIEKAGKCAFIMHDCIVCLGFQITAMRLNSLDRKEVEELL